MAFRGVVAVAVPGTQGLDVVEHRAPRWQPVGMLDDDPLRVTPEESVREVVSAVVAVTPRQLAAASVRRRVARVTARIVESNA